MSQPQLNLAQIDMMVRTIHSLKDEAETISDTLHEQDVAPPPHLVIASRPRTALQMPEIEDSADIINIMDRISDLAADGAQTDDAAPMDIQSPESPNSEASEINIPDIGDILGRIQALVNEADAAIIEPIMDTETDMSDTIADTDVNLEPHKLDANMRIGEDVDAAMADIETAVRQAAPAAADPTEPAANESQMSDNLTGMIRKEVRDVLKAELPDAVRSLVRETLKSEGFIAPTRDKIRTTRFRNL